MNIFCKVTLKSLSRNKTRTLVTIIGIILSAAMLTAVAAFVTSLREYMLDVSVYNDGDWHGCLYDVGADKTAELKNNPELKKMTACENIGYALLPDSKNEYKPYMYIIGADGNFFDMMPVHLKEGKYPETADEIILPVHMRKNGGMVYSIGDKLTLDIGKRIYKDLALNQNNPYMKNKRGLVEEELLIQQTRSYTVVGFYERPGFEGYSAPGYTAVTVMGGTIPQDRLFDVYIKLKKPVAIYDFISGEEKREGFNGSRYNDDLLMYSGVSKHSQFYTVLYSLAAILILLIMAGSVSLIFNAFSISVSERTKQIGLLSSVGATKKQIRKSILYEAMFVSMVGIPIGILSGIAGIGVTFLFTGRSFASLFYREVPYSLTLHVNFMTVAAAALIALITVLISAWIPSLRATRITAIEAIRQTKDIFAKAKDVRTSKLMYRLFGLEGALARKHFKRSRKKYRTTVVSLFVSIVLFISASSFCSYIKDSAGSVLRTRDYDISWAYDAESNTELTPREVYELLAQTNGVTESAYAFVEQGSAQIEEEDVTDGLKHHFNESMDVYDIPACVYVVPDEVFDGYTDAGGLEGKDAVVMAFVEGIDPKTNKYVKTDILRGTVSSIKLKLYNEIREPIPDDLTDEELDKLQHKNIVINAVAVVDTLPFAINGYYHGRNITVMLPERYIGRYLGNMHVNDVVYYFKGKDHAVLADNLIAVMAENGLPSENLNDTASRDDTDRNMLFIINVFTYGFIILISLIAAANVFNTISTGINLRRREFAMLKSVGMTQKGFRKMMNYECMMYGTKSLMWGLPAAIGITWLIFRSVNEGYATGFYIPWTSMAVAIFSVFAVVFSTMLYSMNKLKDDNTIDSLRNENL